MKLGFIKSNFPNEQRVPLFPKDIKNFNNEIYIEQGLGDYLDIPDQEYRDKGAVIVEHNEIFALCDGVFSLKLIQPIDYELIRKGQIIIGWTHPKGSGKSFMEKQALPKELIVVDLDNRSPTVFYQNNEYRPSWIPENFIYQNSFYAGYAGTIHALLSHGMFPNESTKIAILGSGNVAQGSFHAISKFSSNLKMFYRRTLPQFKEQIDQFDIIINGIEVGDDGNPIISLSEQKKLKANCFVIDIAADAGNAIENTHGTNIDEPIYKKDGIYYYVVPNTPSLVYRNISKIISEQFSKYVYSKDIDSFIRLVSKD
ncbi:MULTISPECIES: N(5)-(carboxyethyl)ornithine synthase [unclassified Enterococcus]|uniref:N(5)-(carboxyethyl)ornithine synthase n=1 Tax=unclassified Enterococcus TaxID=2608891 RepID=UPI001557E391|nr:MULTISPECIES: N(5)-(carboxyethyl)ornithine synthase [unclassified Enterococcus]MBS7576848.1 N(5)-(carboxyethyl)ornithine synthase [Enterococcus sp. MMGLQ5-2]MBS7584255.1 N(5)-(carboxyethyl)ornithine synthase [Enterococcus sp. MMGLQ5-1]NPD12111.1 N(5)-(carboxyethyl)ornithine synthase [Enterococcus sp. MMGLQ5-1]NPD36683.1 N(5)-(carboxyethyl)ornithine synthase [Enterococcus sp. MMGLQ5-2]